LAKGTGFKKFNSEDRELTLLQDNVDQAFAKLGTSTIQNGLLLQVALVTGANTVTHKLGRKIRGALICSNSTGANLSDNIATGTDLQQNFILTASADATVTLWVF
jgi:hypothetical protein